MQAISLFQNDHFSLQANHYTFQALLGSPLLPCRPPPTTTHANGQAHAPHNSSILRKGTVLPGNHCMASTCFTLLLWTGLIFHLRCLNFPPAPWILIPGGIIPKSWLFSLILNDSIHHSMVSTTSSLLGTPRSGPICLDLTAVFRKPCSVRYLALMSITMFMGTLIWENFLPSVVLYSLSLGHSNPWIPPAWHCVWDLICT